MDPALREEIDRLHARICHALADPTRILILYTLSARPLHVGELSEAVEISQPSASRHLKVLRERGLVTAQREGQSVLYSIADPRIVKALDILRAMLADQLQSQGALAERVIREFQPE